MDIDKFANCTCFSLRKASRAVTQVYDEALKPTGLRTTQFSLLNAIDKRAPVLISELAEVLVMDRSTLTRNLRPLLESELIEVVASEDGRQRPVVLTRRGKGKLKDARPIWRTIQNKIAKGLGKERWTRLIGDLDEAVRVARLNLVFF